MSDLTFTEKEKLANKLNSPVRWGETYLKNREGSPRKYWPHQIEDLECRDRNIICRSSRELTPHRQLKLTPLFTIIFSPELDM